MPRDRENKTLTIQLETGDKERLEAIALKFGFTWGDRPNISALLKEIAKESILTVNWADTPPVDNPQRVAINGAIALIQEGLSKLLRLI